ncbi:matrixin family metalloprotease [Bdellovibrio reynosensis]|uniref:Matrixin family metalloprotease n=1 Tax=Bdellovibrio reynosensis TaxID=2835041 RepID=A0ABY4C8B0_9BACT|nr:matrixin family metalloprotease [Bdellovibrio reynosensis]UOF00152.1 matrixin family metalloprotease [Bdellovibrio reynosensis]
MIRKFAVASFLVFVCACSKNSPTLGPGDENQLASAAETNCGFVSNSYGQRVSWKKNIPLTLKVYNDFPTEYLEVLNKAAAHWNDAAGMTLLMFENTGTSLAATSKDGANTLLWKQEWPEKLSKLQGVTNLYWNNNELTEADIQINNKNFNFFTESATTPYDLHLESLLIHELGHALGLRHQSTVPSVMWAILNGGVKRIEISAADRESIKCEY